MARTRSRGKLLGLFKSNFKITFFYKPTMLNDDIYYYIGLDDIVLLRIRPVNDAIVIDDVIPLTTAYLTKTYDLIVQTLVGQSNFTVMISILGNTGVLHPSCIKANTPVIEDQRFISIPEKLYMEWKEYCKEDNSKYGFYLLSVKESKQTEQKEDPTIEPTSQRMEVGFVPTIDKIMGDFKKLNRQSMYSNRKLIVEKGEWETGQFLNVLGITFWMIYKKEDGKESIILNDMDTYNLEDFHAFLRFCETLETYCEDCIIVFNQVQSGIIQTTCEARKYKKIKNGNRCTSNMLSSNSKYFSDRSLNGYMVIRN